MKVASALHSIIFLPLVLTVVVMAIIRPLLATSLLLCSLLVIASANDYGYDSSNNQANGYGKQPEEKKPDYCTRPTPKEEEKPGYGTKPEEKPESEEEKKPDYGTKPEFYKPQPEENKKPESSEEEEKPSYSTNPDFYKPISYEKQKFSYGTQPYIAKPNPKVDERPEALPIGVQGLVLCKAGPKYYPIQGALARITCLSVDENGYEKTHSVCSGETDAKGYFFATFYPLLGLDDDDQLTKLTDCKAFLESSPLETCNVPVDVNEGISGAPLSDFHVLDQNRLKLYTVGPFLFSSEPNSVPNGY